MEDGSDPGNVTAITLPEGETDSLWAVGVPWSSSQFCIILQTLSEIASNCGNVTSEFGEPPFVLYSLCQLCLPSSENPRRKIVKFCAPQLA